MVDCLQEDAVMSRLFVRHRGNMEVSGCLEGNIEVNVAGIAAVE